MAEGVFDPEVYGEPFYTDNQFDTEVYGELGDDVSTAITAGYGQAQAQILAFGTNKYAQAQADVKQTYNSYAQAQAKLANVARGFGQAQADIKQIYRGYGQANASITTIKTGKGQANALIGTIVIYDSFSRVVSVGSAGTPDIGSAYNSGSGTSYTYVSVSGSELVFSDPNSTDGFGIRNDEFVRQGLNTVDFQFNQLTDTAQFIVLRARLPIGSTSGTSIIVEYDSGTGLATLRTSVVGSSISTFDFTPSINTWYRAKLLYNGTTVKGKIWKKDNAIEPDWQVSTTTSTVTGAGQSLVGNFDGLSISNPYVTSVDNYYVFTLAEIIKRGYGQAQARIIYSGFGEGQAQAQILAIGKPNAQAQADIKVTTTKFAQSNAYISVRYFALSQAQGQIIITLQQYAQAQAKIISSGINNFGQTQADIKATSDVYAQAQAHVIYPAAQFAQAQSLIVVKNIQAYGQSLATITNLTAHGYARATIKVMGNNKFAQSLANIDSPIKVYSAQSQAFIDKSAGYGQALAFITLNKVWAQAQGQVKKLSNRAYGTARAFLINKKKHGHAMADIKKTSRGYAYAVGLIFHPRGLGQAMAYISPGRGRAFAQAKAYLWPYHFAQAMAIINPANKYGQAQARIRILKIEAIGQTQAFMQIPPVFGQAQGYIGSTKAWKFGQAAAHILGNVAYGQAQGKITVEGTLLYDTFSRERALTTGFGTPDFGPDWANFSGDVDLVYLDGSKIVLDYVNVYNQYSYFYAYAPINAINADLYAEFNMSVTNPPPYVEFDLRDNYVTASIDTTSAWVLFAYNGGNISSSPYVLTENTWYSVRLRAVDTVVKFKVWEKGTPEPDAWLLTISSASVQLHSGYTALYADNYNGNYIETGHTYIDNMRVIKAANPGHAQAMAKINQPNPYQYGQAQGTISQPSPYQYGQAQARILPTFGTGQAQVYISSLGFKSAQANASIVTTIAYAQAQAHIGPFFTDMFADALTYILPIGYNQTAYVDLGNYTSESTDPDPNYAGINPSDGSWGIAYDSFEGDHAPNGWAYFTLTDESNIHLDTLEFFGFNHDTILGIFTGTSAPGSWTVVIGNDDMLDGIFAITYESVIDITLSAGTYLILVGSYPDVTPEYTHVHIVVTPPAGYGQAQAKITTPFGEGQAQAFIKKLKGIGQANAKIKSFGNNAYGLAMARIRLNYTFVLNPYGQYNNASSAYQSYYLDNYTISYTAYYSLNEPFLTGTPYASSNMLYKNTAWDNMSLFDLDRPFGLLGYGPYGGESSLVPTVNDTAILSSTNSAGFDYLQQFGATLPGPGASFYGSQIMFWFKPKEIRTTGSAVLLLLVGGTSDTSLGAISFKYEPTGLLSVYYGNGTTATLILQYNGLILNQTYFVGFIGAGTGGFIQAGYSPTSLIINGDIVSTSSQFTSPTNTIFIGGGTSDTYKFVLDELIYYGIATNVSFNLGQMKGLYFIGMGWAGGFGQAQALIINKVAFGQTQADIRVPWHYGQSQAHIIQNLRKYAQAQAYIFGTQIGQAQALIDNGQRMSGQAQTYISTKSNKYGQARALVSIPKKHAQAQAVILVISTGISTDGEFSAPSYLVEYNGYRLPGYAQEEFANAVMRINSIDGQYNYIPYSEYNGLQNKLISLRMKVVGENYLDCKNQIELASTMLRSKRSGFTKLYIQYPDRYYEALTKTIKTSAVVTQTVTSEYNIDFEAKPWLMSDFEVSLTGTSTVSTTGRTLDDGGWTPTTITLTGTNVTVSGYTATGDFAGFISVSGFVSNLEINAETYDTSINGVILNDNYQVYVGPGVTTFEITGATDFNLKYRNRWYL